MANGKKPETATIPTKITKVLFHDSTEKIGFLARMALEAIDDGDPSQDHMRVIRRLMVSPPMDTVTLRRNIADAMVQYGRYVI